MLKKCKKHHTVKKRHRRLTRLGKKNWTPDNVRDRQPQNCRPNYWHPCFLFRKWQIPCRKRRLSRFESFVFPFMQLLITGLQETGHDDFHLSEFTVNTYSVIRSHLTYANSKAGPTRLHILKALESWLRCFQDNGTADKLFNARSNNTHARTHTHTHTHKRPR